MNFVSIAFFIFFSLVLLTQCVIKNRRVRHIVLLAASYVFYGWWDWRFCFLMLFLTAVAYFSALSLERKPGRKGILALGVGVPLAVLFLFKYLNFFIDSFCALFGMDSPGTLAIILPVGISFYTFQSLSYTIDVWRGRVKVQHDFVRFALYIAFFPQLVAGPIVKAADFLPQLEEERRPTPAGVYEGLNIFFWGMFKKAVLADHLSVLVDTVYAAPMAYSSGTVALAVLAYAFQIYFDFSGYSDMAIGCAKCIGYDLQKNFDLPYISANVSEFWKRWHISLSTWLQEYLYISLGGNRRGAVRTYVNLMLTMLLGGLWHGAGMNFVLWGALHGGALCVHKLWLKCRYRGNGGAAARIAGTLITFLFVSLCWVFFRAESFKTAVEVLTKLFVWTGGVRHMYTWALVSIVMMICATAWCMRFGRDEKGVVHGVLPVFRSGTFLGTLGFALLVGFTIITMYTGGSPFIYFQF